MNYFLFHTKSQKGITMKFAYLFLGFLFVMLLISGCGNPADNDGSPKWNSFTDRFINQYFEYNPVNAAYAGKHEYDGQLPKLTRERIQKQINWLKAYRDSADAFDNETLSSQQEFEREYFLWVIDSDLFWLEDAQSLFRDPKAYSGIMDPSIYITMNYAPLETRMKAYTKYAAAVPKFIEQMQNNLETPLPQTFAIVGMKAFLGYTDYFRNDVPGVFSSVENEELQSNFKQANQKAIKASEKAGNWFKSQLEEANGSFALGADLFKKMLWKTERVDISLDTLRKIGEEDLNRNLAAIKQACKKIAPGKSIEECISMVQAFKPKNGPVDKAREQLDNLKQFVINNNIVSIPGTEDAEVAKSPPYNRSNLAYINIPGPFEEGIPSTYYISPPDPTWTEKQQAAYIPSVPQLLFISVHEVWPGHFLNFLFIQNSPTLLKKLFGSYAFIEGWAHYTEEMMWDEGLGNGDPKIHIGQLLGALKRNVRFLSAIGLHTGTMTVEESEKIFKEKAFLDYGNAKQQAARGTYDPAYLNYTLGKLMIKKLRNDWLKQNPDKTLKDFHNEFLSHGAPPVPLVRKLMLRENDDGSLF